MLSILRVELRNGVSMTADAPVRLYLVALGGPRNRVIVEVEVEQAKVKQN